MAVCIVKTFIVVPIITGLWYRSCSRGMAEAPRSDGSLLTPEPLGAG